MMMNVINLAAFAHAKPITLPVTTASAGIDIEGHSRYVVTSSVGVFIRVGDKPVSPATFDASAQDIYIPANCPTLLPATGKEWIAVIGVASGFVQLVKNG